MKHDYTYNELISEIKILRNTFDIVRVVDPIICKVISEEILKESDTVDKLMPELLSAGLTGKDGFCFNVWSNESRRSNCISARTLIDKDFYVKFENINKNLYYIISKYINVDGRSFALEMVKDISRNFIFSEDEMFNTILDLKHKNKQLITDPLTNVYNRRYVEEHFINSYSRMKKLNRSVCLAILDIDNFKEVNDNYGHRTGDQILNYLAESWNNSLKDYKNTFIARYGGDEFIIVYESENYDEFQKMIFDIFTPACSYSTDENGNNIKLTVSVGCAGSDEIESDEFYDLFNLADNRLYQAKASGKSAIISK